MEITKYVFDPQYSIPIALTFLFTMFLCGAMVKLVAWMEYKKEIKLQKYKQRKLLQLIADGTLTIERVQSDEVEKPKNDFIVADDGELLEVINDDKPKRGISHDG